MRKNRTIRFFTHGGIVSPGELRTIAHFAIRNSKGSIHFGIRQDVMLELEEGCTEKEITRSLKSSSIPYEVSTDFNSRNIGSSIVSLDLFPTTVWLKSDVYFDILESIKETPKLKVNITDPVQGLVALYKGNVNFIASKIPGFWYVSIEMPWDKKRVFWPNYIATDDIAKFIEELESSKAFENKLSNEDFFSELAPKFRNVLPSINETPTFRKRRFPNYDGLHKYGEDKYWIGLFDRNNRYSAEFIEELCLVCSQTKAGNIFITPWNSIIIKELNRESLKDWDKLLGKYGINIQHSSVELNWQVPSLDHKANKLKNYITKVFNKEDVRTYGLTFGIRTRPVFISTSVIIRKAKKKNIFGKNYKIIYSKSFNHNNNDFVKVGSRFTKKELPGALMDICEKYNQWLLNNSGGLLANEIEEAESATQEFKMVYECQECLSVYDRDFHDGQKFRLLPDDWKCPVCEAEKSAYEPKQVERQSVALA